MKDVDDLDGYERGVVARALLERLIKQGRLEERQDQGRPFEIVIPVSQSQLRLLALFSEDGDAGKRLEAIQEAEKTAITDVLPPGRGQGVCQQG